MTHRRGWPPDCISVQKLGSDSMKKLAFPAFLAVLAALTWAGDPSSARADDEAPAEDDLKFDLAEGRFLLTAPEGWLRKKPANRIIEHEFQVPASEGDERP